MVHLAPTDGPGSTPDQVSIKFGPNLWTTPRPRVDHQLLISCSMVDPSLLEKHGPIVVQLHPTNSWDHGGGKHSTSLLPSSNSKCLLWVVFMIASIKLQEITGKWGFIIESLYYNFSATERMMVWQPFNGRIKPTTQVRGCREQFSSDSN